MFSRMFPINQLPILDNSDPFQRLVGCKKGNRSRLFQSVMRVVMGEATTAQSAAQENLHRK